LRLLTNATEVAFVCSPNVYRWGRFLAFTGLLAMLTTMLTISEGTPLPRRRNEHTIAQSSF